MAETKGFRHKKKEGRILKKKEERHYASLLFYFYLQASFHALSAAFSNSRIPVYVGAPPLRLIF
jgi:hypothetical protein